MKIAIFHNFMNNIGGAEKVALILARELNADVYSTVVDQAAIRKLGFSTKVRKIGPIPHNPPWRQQLALARFRQLNLRDKYDFFIIAGDWALSAAVNHKPNMWYCHTPPRELWDLYDYTRTTMVPAWGKKIFDGWVHYNRHLYTKYLAEVDMVACSSLNAQFRLADFLKRQSTLIYPPIDVARYRYEENGNFWLSVNRLIPYKRIDLQLQAFAQMPNERLIVVGSYERARHFVEHARHLRRMAPPNVAFIHWADEEQLIDLYARCKGLIATSFGEDFGMSAIEAMAAGKPVVAVAQGGYLETMIDRVTGRLTSPAVEDLVTAIQEVGKHPERFRADCIARAQQFDTRQCVAAMRDLIMRKKQEVPTNAVTYQ